MNYQSYNKTSKKYKFNYNLMETATLICPKCGNKQIEIIPQNYCQPFYKCDFCKQIIQAKKNDCCVFCSYADKPCPIKNHRKNP